MIWSKTMVKVNKQDNLIHGNHYHQCDFGLLDSSMQIIMDVAQSIIQPNLKHPILEKILRDLNISRIQYRLIQLADVFLMLDVNYNNSQVNHNVFPKLNITLTS